MFLSVSTWGNIVTGRLRSPSLEANSVPVSVFVFSVLSQMLTPHWIVPISSVDIKVCFTTTRGIFDRVLIDI